MIVHRISSGGRVMAGALAFAVALMPVLSRAASAGPCTSAAYHQFDFFLGRWHVTDRSGKALGTDTVTVGLGGCIEYEDYRDAGDPSRGFGIAGYQSGLHRWRQTFIDDSGLVLTLDGAPAPGAAMILEGTDYPGGHARRNRGVWTVRDGVVEEVWTRSTDDGKTWKTVFDGFFHPLSH